MSSLNKVLAYVDDITLMCYYGATTSFAVNPATYFTVENFALNVLFNVGYMYTAVDNIIDNDPSTQTNWPYYLAEQVGDFLIRWFYRDTSVA